MPSTAATAQQKCEACETLSMKIRHTCEEACGKCGIVQVEVRRGTPPSKTAYMDAVKDAVRDNQATDSVKASAKPFKAGVAVSLPRRVKPSTEKQVKDFVFPERWGGPALTTSDRELLVMTVARAYWSGGFKKQSLSKMVAALLAAKVVVEPWKCGWFEGFVDGSAAAKKRSADAARGTGAAKKKAAHARFDEDDFEDQSGTHSATYSRLAMKIAISVAKRDNKPRPTYDEIWADAASRYYWLDIANRIGPVCDSCFRSFGGRDFGSRWYIEIEHRNGGPHDGELSDAAACWKCNQASRARADTAAAALHAHGATYTRADAGAIGRGSLALMGRASGAAAAQRLARVRAATVTCSADDAALEEADEPTPARDRGDGVERFDPAARDRAPRAASMKSCPACSAMIPRGCKTCPTCRKPCTKKRKT